MSAEDFTLLFARRRLPSFAATSTIFTAQRSAMLRSTCDAQAFFDGGATFMARQLCCSDGCHDVDVYATRSRARDYASPTRAVDAPLLTLKCRRFR